MLKHVHERVSPITVQPHESAYALTTYLDALDLEKGVLFFDRPLPDNRLHLLKERKVNLETLHNGCRLTCVDLLLTSVADAQGNLRYQTQLPEQVYYLQRRRSFRAPVRPLLEIAAHVKEGASAGLRGRLKDLSVDGCRLQFRGDQRESVLALGDELNLVLCFPNGHETSLCLHPLRADFDEAKEQTFVGCRFGLLDPQQRHMVARVVTDLQRDYINYVRNEGDPAGTPALFVPVKHKVYVEAEPEQAPKREEAAPAPAMEAKPRQAAPPKAPVSAARVAIEAPPVNIQRAHQSGIVAVKQLAARLRLQQSLPLTQAAEAAENLLQAWRQDRQGLLLQCRLRNQPTLLFEHSVSVAVTLVDCVASQLQEQVRDDTLLQLLLGGLCHDLAKALIDEGLQETRLRPPLELAEQWRQAQLTLLDQLASSDEVSRELLNVVRESHERLDGSGLPHGLTEAEQNRVGKLAAAINAHDRLSYVIRDEDIYYHPLQAFRQLFDISDQYHQPSLKRLLHEQGRYPLGSLVRLSDNTLALVLRQDEQSQPSHVRVVYNLGFESHQPPRDRLLSEAGLQVEGAVSPIRYEISSRLLKMPIRL